MIHLIYRQGAPVTVQYDSRQYVVGFKNKLLARKVHYQMQPDKLTLLVGADEPSAITRNLLLDRQTTLFIPKNERCIDAVMDHGLYMMSEMQNTFYAIPFRNQNTGILMPMEILDETLDDMTLRCLMVVPKN